MKKETPKYDVYIDVKSEDFVAAPSEFQRSWMLQRAMREFADDLDHLDRISTEFVPGVERPEIADEWKASDAAYDDKELIIQGQQVMQAWERQLMRRLAEVAAASHGDVLEIGFGMGISPTFIQEVGAKSYTVVECNEQVIERFHEWTRDYPGADLRVVAGMWQDVQDQLGRYDGILFDTYPLTQEEYERNEVAGTAYSHAAEFFPQAAAKLRPGGVFTYFSCEIDTLSRGHQRELLRYFDAFEVELVKGLQPPDGCQYWWSDTMVVVSARKR